MGKYAIDVQHVSKNFILPHKQANSIKSLFTRGYKKGITGRDEVQHALRDITFTIKKGEFFGIVGRNGSGKSTLLKILAGIYQPTEGKVEVNGKLVPFIELGVGFNPELTGRENVYLNGAMLGFTRKQIDEMYDDIVVFAELERFMDQKLKNYSSGMQVRLAFSMATRSEADILLVDEVLAVGDADFQRKCFEYFRELKKKKKTVVFVSHDMNAVREYCDQAVLIEKSELVLRGTADEIASAYTKMFTPQQDEENEPSEATKRWGDGGMTQLSCAAVTKTVRGNEAVTIEVEFAANKRVENPVLGILVKTASGTHVLGTNTKLKKIKTGVFEAGEKGKIRWVIPGIFNDGKHYVDVALSHQDAITQYDWWEEAAAFKVYKEERTPFLVNPEIAADFER